MQVLVCWRASLLWKIGLMSIVGSNALDACSKIKPSSLIKSQTKGCRLESRTVIKSLQRRDESTITFQPGCSKKFSCWCCGQGLPATPPPKVGISWLRCMFGSSRAYAPSLLHWTQNGEEHWGRGALRPPRMIYQITMDWFCAALRFQSTAKKNCILQKALTDLH